MQRTLAKGLLAFAAVLAATGCGSVYRQNAAEFESSQPESAWGQRPPSGHQVAEAAVIKARLRDPYSADIRAGSVARYVLPESFASTTPVPVWGSQVLVNAKNAYGAFTGFKEWIFFYRNGVMFAVQDEQGVKTWVGRSDNGAGVQRAVNDLRRQLGQ